MQRATSISSKSGWALGILLCEAHPGRKVVGVVIADLHI